MSKPTPPYEFASAPDWVRFDNADFQNATALMGWRARAAYRSIIFALYTSKGFIPDDDTKLARAADMPLKEWKKVRDEALEKCVEWGGFWTQKRVFYELFEYNLPVNTPKRNRADREKIKLRFDQIWVPNSGCRIPTLDSVRTEKTKQNQCEGLAQIQSDDGAASVERRKKKEERRKKNINPPTPLKSDHPESPPAATAAGPSDDDPTMSKSQPIAVRKSKSGYTPEFDRIWDAENPDRKRVRRSQDTKRDIFGKYEKCLKAGDTPEEILAWLEAYRVDDWNYRLGMRKIFDARDWAEENRPDRREKPSAGEMPSFQQQFNNSMGIFDEPKRTKSATLEGPHAVRVGLGLEASNAGGENRLDGGHGSGQQRLIGG